MGSPSKTGPLVIDFHTHILPPWLRDNREHYMLRDSTFRELFEDSKAKMATADELVTAMDDDGVGVSVVMGIGWTDRGLARETNDYIIESVSQYPGRLVGFAGVNPTWGEDAAREADRCANLGLRGVGELHPDTQSFDLGDEGTMRPLMEAVRHHNLVVTTHSSEPVGHRYPGKGSTTPGVLWRFVQSYPDIPVVCAHWGGGLPFYALMPEVMEGLRNVYFDCAASPFLYRPQVFKIAASLIGPRKILYGSDFPLLRSRRALSELESSGLSAADMESIKWGNASGLLSRQG